MHPAPLAWLGLLCLALNVHAHVGRGFVVSDNVSNLTESQNWHARSTMIRARARTQNEASFASIKSHSRECKGYAFPSSHALRKAYPSPNKVAHIVHGDNEARTIWNEIQSSGTIPSHVAVKQGTAHHYGIAQSQSSSYPSHDPDCWWTQTGCTTPKASGLSNDISSCPEPNTWGLTFDDGPECGHNEFYDYLQQQNLKATMFYIGSNVMNNPLQAQRGLADGHDICVHTWSHRYTTTLSDESVFAELYYTMRIIKDVLGVTPQCWRPPFGDVDDRVRAIANGLGLRTILWDQDTDDWDIAPGGASSTQKIDANYNKIITLPSKGKTGKHGVVVLTHEVNKHTMDEFMRQYPKVQSAYEHVVPLSACFNVTHPYAENTPVYPTFDQFVSGNEHAQSIPDLSQYQVHVGSQMNIVPERRQPPGHFSNSQ